jgi:hypothetical protein
METTNKLVRVFAGSEMTVNLLQFELEKREFQQTLSTNMQSQISGGFQPERLIL